jgi:hypothetical protein
MRTIEYRTVIEHQPIDAEAAIYNALVDSLTLGPLTFEDQRLTPSDKRQELGWVASRLLANLLLDYQLVPKRRGEPPTTS